MHCFSASRICSVVANAVQQCYMESNAEGAAFFGDWVEPAAAQNALRREALMEAGKESSSFAPWFVLLPRRLSFARLVYSPERASLRFTLLVIVLHPFHLASQEEPHLYSKSQCAPLYSCSVPERFLFSPPETVFIMRLCIPVITASAASARLCHCLIFLPGMWCSLWLMDEICHDVSLSNFT